MTDYRHRLEPARVYAHVEALLREPNADGRVRQDLVCHRAARLRQVLDVVPADRVLYGTDWPFYHQALTLADDVVVLAKGRVVLSGSREEMGDITDKLLPAVHGEL